MKPYKAGLLEVRQYETRRDMGLAAAADVSRKIRELLSEKDVIRMVFAAAPSQNEFLKALISDPEIDFSRITAFHMDEYIGLPADAPQRFGKFLNDRIFSKRDFFKVFYINGQAEDPSAECACYAELLAEAPVDIVCMGIGENGHIAFNDPGVADFSDPHMVKIAELDEACRRQQVNDGCFQSIDDVPTHAITLTIPVLINAGAVFCVVPSVSKSTAVYNTLNGEITEDCPASILRKADGAVLYLDSDSASKL